MAVLSDTTLVQCRIRVVVLWYMASPAIPKILLDDAGQVRPGAAVRKSRCTGLRELALGGFLRPEVPALAAPDGRVHRQGAEPSTPRTTGSQRTRTFECCAGYF